MNIPKELFYTQSHEWVNFISDDTATIGLTDHAQDQLGDIVFVELPYVGDVVAKGQSVVNVESVKAVSDVFCPVAGTISKANDDVANAPETINQDPYGAWLIEVSGITNKETLLTAEEYEKFVAEEA